MIDRLKRSALGKRLYRLSRSDNPLAPSVRKLADLHRARGAARRLTDPEVLAHNAAQIETLDAFEARLASEEDRS